MRQALTVARLQMRLVSKSVPLMTVMLAMPLLFTLVLGMLMGGNTGTGTATGHAYPVAVIDKDGTFASQRLIEVLQGEKNLRLQPNAEGDLKKLFADKRIDSALIIPGAFQAAVATGANPEVQLVAPPGGNLQVGVGPVVRRAAAQVAEDYRLALQVSEASSSSSAGASSGDAGASTSDAGVREAYARIARDRQAQPVSVSQEPVKRPSARHQSGNYSLGEYALGFAVTFIMIMIFTMAGAILQERQMGTWGRLLTTPASRASLITGYLISFFLTGMLQFVLLLGASTLLFHIQWGPLLPLLAMAAAFVLCSAGMGLFLAGIVRTPEQQGAIGTLLVTATSMLGGVYWPLDFVSNTMRHIGYLTPQAWAMDGFREVVLRGGSWSGLVWPLTVLLLFAVIFMTAGLFRVRYE